MIKHQIIDIIRYCYITLVSAVFFALIFPNFALADEFTSSSFRVLDPVLAPAGYSTSTGFQLWSTITEIALGTSSASSFSLGSDFLRFPFASTPAVSATAGNAQVALSWTASQGFSGWTASGYNIGQSTTSGGPYTYTSFGNVLSSTRTGLTNSTTYYFVIIVKDIFGYAIATSTQVSATPTAPATTPAPTPTPTPTPSGGGGGGGGGGGYVAPTTPASPTAVILSGRAYPLSKVSVLKDGQLAVTTIAGPDSNFTITISDLSAGNYKFSVYSEDGNNIRSSPFTFPIYITAGATTKIDGIFIAPTIAVDKSQVKRGDTIAIFGQSAQASEIIISVNSEQEIFVTKKSDDKGVYLLNFDTSVLDLGQHSTKAKASLSGEISAFSNTLGFLVGTKNMPAAVGKIFMKGDLNEDGHVNLVDFSIAAFWYKRPLSALFAPKEVNHLNGDGKIDLVDFSIMAFYWTG